MSLCLDSMLPPTKNCWFGGFQPRRWLWKAGVWSHPQPPKLPAPDLLSNRIDATGGGKDKDSAEEYALSVVAANGTSWPSLQKFILPCEAEVILGQEHRLPQRKITAASRWCENHGWKSIWSAANPSELGGDASGGTFILARKHLGFAAAEDLLVPSARAVAAKLDFPGGGELCSPQSASAQSASRPRILSCLVTSEERSESGKAPTS